MLPFELTPIPGRPISEQIVFAVKKALVRGRLKPGDAFPSVRTMSRELRINPNTAQKVVTQLTGAKILEIEPGIGARVAAALRLDPAEKSAAVADRLDALSVEARRIGLTLSELQAQLRESWHNLNPKSQ